MMQNFSYWLFSIASDGKIESKFGKSSRFVSDKVDFEDDDFVIVSDGIVLNKFDILNSGNSLKDYYKSSYDNICLLKALSGPFNGLVFNKNERKGIAFGNQTGDSSVFYGFTKDNTLLISNNYNEVWKRCDNRTINEKAAHFQLTYGFYADESTIVDSINKVRPGEYIEFTQNGFSIKTYHRFNFHDKINISIDEAIEQLDVLFRKAVKRCFDKDLEYGFQGHLADLSAGLDSRMTNVVAKELGYEGIINISYSQSNSTESKYTNLLSHVLANPLYYRSLDDVSFIYDIEKMVKEEFGMAYYCGMTGAYQFLNLIDFSNIGLEHTGQLGDVIISTHGSNFGEVNTESGRNSTMLALRYKPNVELYSSQEEFNFYTRYFQGTLATHYVRSNYTYAVSPFIDVELLAFCASLPNDIRENHKLYWNWIDQKYPEYSNIPSSRLRRYDGMSCRNKILMYSNRVKGKLKRDGYHVAKIIGLSKTGTSPDNMNPHTYWYDTNLKMRSFIHQYFDEHICLLDAIPEVKEEAVLMFNSKSALDKLMAISLLATIKQYCGL